MEKTKTCNPLKCRSFAKVFEVTYQRFLKTGKWAPMDDFLLQCPYLKGIICSNEIETLEKVEIK